MFSSLIRVPIQLFEPRPRNNRENRSMNKSLISLLTRSVTRSLFFNNNNRLIYLQLI